VQSNHPQGVHSQKGSNRDIFDSHFLEGAVGHRVMQEVHRPGKSLRVGNLSEEIKYYYCRCAQSRRLRHLDEVEGLSQGVRARRFF